MKNPYISRFFLVLGLFLSFSGNRAVAEPKRPEFPKAETDPEIFKGTTPEAYFEARLKDATCRKFLGTTKVSYEKAQADYLLAIEKGTPQESAAAWKKAERARNVYLRHFEKCGECAVKPTRGENLRAEFWYASDGSCLVQGTADEKKSAFKKMSDALITLKEYPRRLGGYSPILDIFAVDGTSGQILDKVQQLGNPPEWLFLVIQGDPIGIVADAFTYLTKVSVERSQTNGLDEFVFKYEANPDVGFGNPAAFQPPELPYKKIRPLSRVKGWWYLRSDGYMRYFTAADFGFKTLFIQQLGQAMHFDLMEKHLSKGIR